MKNKRIRLQVKTGKKLGHTFMQNVCPNFTPVFISFFTEDLLQASRTPE
jgi:hypothetical protein